ncbi:unnamed protein product [Durusdinium trenchii]|uniref:Uncharacterized protein n=1 Tax=Durusdinium trenchii TaxID=1381693 RepID=A0ABP0Q830_9DINO
MASEPPRGPQWSTRTAGSLQLFIRLGRWLDARDHGRGLLRSTGEQNLACHRPA